MTAYVATEGPDVVRPVRLGTRKLLPPVRVRGQAFPVAVTPDGTTAVAVTYIGRNRTVVTLIHTATGKAFKTVKLTLGMTPAAWPSPRTARRCMSRMRIRAR